MLERLLDESALVTLTGPGGAGKTRLAIETARRRAASFADGAWLVRLEGIEDPELVLDAIAGPSASSSHRRPRPSSGSRRSWPVDRSCWSSTISST